MTSSVDLWFNGNKELVWDKFCGYLHLSLPAFMHIQETLLLEQIKLLQGCELGEKLLGNQKINSVADFRQKVPLTTYSDYEPYLSKKREDVLPAKTKVWAFTISTGAQQRWAPVSDKAYEVLADSMLGLFILSTAKNKGDFKLQPGDVMFAIPPPPPWFQNLGMMVMQKNFGLKIIPEQNEAFNKLSFAERTTLGFHTALRTGVDVVCGQSGVLLGMGQSFSNYKWNYREFTDIRLSYRLFAGWIKNNLHINNLLPKHVWKLKSLLVSGTDVDALGPKLKHYWGADPFELYINTEFGCYLGSLSWNRKGMTFTPYVGFLEFIPIENEDKGLNRQNKEPNTILLNQVKKRQLYEIIFTNLNGGIFARYRPGDVIEFIELEDKDTGIMLPQFKVKGRADKLIDIGSFTRIDEKTLWLALERAGIDYNNWMARKEIEKGEPVLSLYLDSSYKEDVNSLTKLLHEKLQEVDSAYKDLEEMSGLKPLRVKLLPAGTLSQWENDMLKAGKDFGWVKEQRMQASDEVVEDIMRIVKV